MARVKYIALIVIILCVDLWYSVQRFNSRSIPQSEAIAVGTPSVANGIEYEWSWEYQRRVLPEHELIFWLIVAFLALTIIVLISLTLHYHLLRVSNKKGGIKSNSAKSWKIWQRKRHRRLQNEVNIMPTITEEEQKHPAVSQIADDPTSVKSLSRWGEAGQV
jgi:hypothetical protein